MVHLPDDSSRLEHLKLKSTIISEMVPLFLRWFSSNARDLPWRHTRDPYAVYVSEIMLQQTQVKTVIPYWLRWMDTFPTIQSLAEAEPARVLKLWEGLGYYSRARNLQKAAQKIVADFGGVFPKSHQAMLELPGVGRYTAGAIASIAFNQPQPILDGNVIRVLTRVAGITENPREKKTNHLLWITARQLVETAASLKRVPGIPAATPRCSHLNQSLMELGALVCTPRQPKCIQCPLPKYCNAFKTHRTEQIPNLGERTKATQVFVAALVIEHKGKFLVRQRGEGAVNAGLWEFPNFETEKSITTPAAINKTALEKLGISLEDSPPLKTIKHSITRYRITLQPWHSTIVPNKKTAALKALEKQGYQWLTLPAMNSLPFSSAHKQILKEISKS